MRSAARRHSSPPPPIEPSTFSYPAGLLTGRMTPAELAKVRAEILGEPEEPIEQAWEPPAPSAPPEPPAASHPPPVISGFVTFGDPGDVPVVVMAHHELRARSLERNAAFVLACIDGSSSIEEIIDIAGLPADQTRRALSRLVREGIVQIRRRSAAAL